MRKKVTDMSLEHEEIKFQPNKVGQYNGLSFIDKVSTSKVKYRCSESFMNSCSFSGTDSGVQSQ